MRLVQCQAVSLHLGHDQLFDKINLVIEQGHHLGLLGRNGEGKSTLLKLLNKQIEPDDGKISFQKNINIQLLPQAVPTDLNGKVIEIVSLGLGEISKVLTDYHQALKNTENDSDITKLQQQIEAQDGWHLYSQMETVISKLQLNPNDEIAELSGGMKRRVLLAKALLTEPDLLLIDEPTNHLDMNSILWLENFLKSYQGAFLMVTHDRAFLQNTTRGILELDRGKLRFFNGDYQYYQKQKASFLASEEKSNKEFDKKLAQEEKWIRQGIKARRTRNEGRVRALKALRQERAQRRELRGSLQLQQSEVQSAGKTIFEVKDLSYQIDNKKIIDHFSCLIARQDKIGIVGPNGSGKTTLLNLILGKLSPSSGEIKAGQQIEVAYFDQMKSQIDDNLSAVNNVGQGSQTIEAFGKSQHIISYLKAFLFSPERARSPVKYLSGGERSRLLLARLFTRNANVLVLDEPTNDLDIESLEMLESFLVEYPGTILIVSHDRAFIENVATSTWVYQGNGKFEEFIDVDHAILVPSSDNRLEKKPKAEPSIPKRNKPVKQKPKKLSYNEQRELDALPHKIDEIEQQISQLQNQLADPDTYQEKDSNSKVVILNQDLKASEQALEQALARWEELES